MANIMMTDRCNLNCPYCFANEFVNKDANEISDEAFAEALDFLLCDNTNHFVGLIGGEPTIHSRFGALLRQTISDKRANHILVYTNGLEIDRHINLLTHEKVHLLVNCNAPSVIGQKRFERLVNNLDLIINGRMHKSHVSLGINLYGDDFPYGYMIDLLKQFELDSVRVSITVPNLDSGRNIDAHQYFLEMKPRMLLFFNDLLEANIVPYFDCNKIPSCLISDDELETYRAYLQAPDLQERILKSNISNRDVRCSPVIDILQDLTAVRCFGLSRITRESIRDYKGLMDLRNHYIRTIDAFGFNTTYSSKCIDCYDRDALHCEGGCLAFKENKILELQRQVAALMNVRDKTLPCE